MSMYYFFFNVLLLREVLLLCDHQSFKYLMTKLNKYDGVYKSKLCTLLFECLNYLFLDLLVKKDALTHQHYF